MGGGQGGGPGPHGSLVPVVGANRTNVPVIRPGGPTPGTVAMTESMNTHLNFPVRENPHQTAVLKWPYPVPIISTRRG